MMLDTETLLPPSWEAMLPQKFSAATTWPTPADEATPADDEHAAAASNRTAPAPNVVLHRIARSLSHQRKRTIIGMILAVKKTGRAQWRARPAGRVLYLDGSPGNRDGARRD